MSELRFDGKVAVITGAGGALGRAYALLFASRGAKVVVNDLGVPMNTKDASVGSSDKSAAQKVVDEIKAAGGTAVADYNGVENGDRIIQTAIDNYGRIDILVNNAGILRDVSFAKMTDAQWNVIQQVHLYGAYKCSKAAWPHMLKQKYGRIIMTSSAAGIYGNFGQANYSAAKLALVGFGASLAKEGQKHNVYVNTIAPVAGSRMTETIMPPDLVAALKPDYIAPVVAYLCSEQSNNNGGLYEVGGGWVSKIRWQRNAGHQFSISKFTPEAVQSKWSAVNEFDEKNVTYPTQLNDSVAVVMANLNNKSSDDDKPAAKPATTQSKSNSNFKSAALFDQMSQALQANPTAVKSVKAVFLFSLTNAGATQHWTLDTKASTPSVSNTKSEKPDVTIQMSDSDFIALSEGKANPQTLFMGGKLKLKGNMATGLKLGDVLKALQPKAKL